MKEPTSSTSAAAYRDCPNPDCNSEVPVGEIDAELVASWFEQALPNDIYELGQELRRRGNIKLTLVGCGFRMSME